MEGDASSIHENMRPYGYIYSGVVTWRSLLTEVEYRPVVSARSSSCSACWLPPMYGGIRM
jgi:hypothetical protein